MYQANLFVPCLVDLALPDIGFATLNLLRRLGVEVNIPDTPGCCGQPFLNEGRVYPMGVIAGEMDYPTQEALRADLDALSKEAFWLDLTGIAKALGSPALASTAILGAFVAKSGLSLTKEDAFLALKDSIPEKKLASNLEAFEAGRLAAGA
ncbi:MAG: 2-oxoacid:acceptor oxidoreductase family protein [Nitrospirota bacterium]|nr:2-oxoacid:acceptor oxidoreductase family protein [Nitrospirota bacterium]